MNKYDEFKNEYFKVVKNEYSKKGYNSYLKILEQNPFNFGKINDVAFKYLSSRMKYLEKEQHLLFMESLKAKTKDQRDQYLYLDGLLNNEKRKTLNKWQEIERDLLIKLGVMNETD